MTQIVVLAGGLGTRMLPLTESVPKILLPVRGRPFLAHLLDRLCEGAATSILLLLGHHGDVVEAALDDAALRVHRDRIPIRCSYDLPGRLGTANALVAALPALEDTFVVTYGDSYLSLDYSAPAAHLRNEPAAEGCMAVFENDGALEPSNASVRGGWVTRYSKGATAEAPLRYIDYGAIALRRSVIEGLPRREVLGLDVVQEDLARRGRLLAYEVTEPFHEIGSLEGLERLERALA